MNCEHGCDNWARTAPPLLSEHHPNCPKYVKKMIKTWTVYPGQDLAPCTEKDPQAVMAWVEEAAPGDTIKIVVGEMSEDVYDELPEYMGP